MGKIVKVVLVALVILGVGVVGGVVATDRAGFGDTCPDTSAAAPPADLSLTNVQATYAIAFGYGRGTQVFDAQVVEASVKSGNLPDKLPVTVLPLRSAEGRSIRDVVAVATRLPNTSTYTFQICATADGDTAGSYKGGLIFNGASVPAGTAPTVEITVQGSSVPYMLFVGGPIFLSLGVFYMTLILVRRAQPSIKPGQILPTVAQQLGSINGLLAVIAGIGAVFTAWRVQCFLSPTWGAVWPDMCVAGVTIIAAVAAAASVPMGLSKEELNIADLAPPKPAKS